MLTVDVLPLVANKAVLYDLADRAKFRSFCVVDTLDIALGLKGLAERNHPNKTTYPVYRVYSPQDPRYHHETSPEWFVLAHKILSEAGLMVQVLNEPHGYEDLRPLAKWGAEVMKRGSEMRPQHRYCMFNFGYKHPDLDRITKGEFDQALIAFEKYPNHILGMRSYFRWKPADEMDSITRYRAIWARCDRLGLPRPKVLCTEGGRDFAGGKGDGWNSVFSQEEYARHLEALNAILSADDVDICIYGYGPGFGWESFNIERANAVLDTMIRVNLAELERTMPRVWKHYIADRKEGATGDAVNVRSLPLATAPKLGEVIINQVVELDLNGESGGYAPIKWDGEAWVYTKGILQFKPVSAPPTDDDPTDEPPKDPSVQYARLPNEDFENLKVLHSGLGDIIRKFE